MKNVSLLILALIGFWCHTSQAAYGLMKFKIKELAPHQYDYSFVWNSVTQEASLRMGLVLEKADPELVGKEIRFSSAKNAGYVPMDVPEFWEGCETVAHWQFEYQPGVPEHLMFVTLRGPSCERMGQLFDILQIRMHFKEVAISSQEKSNINIDISR